MSNTTIRLAVIVGSVREGRFGPVVANWFSEIARADDRFAVDVIDLADYPLPLELPATPLMMEPNPVRAQGMDELTRRLGDADAFVIVTPDINRSYPASIKSAIDWHLTQWQHKAIGFVGYSGASGGLLAIEHLRQVFNELDAHTVRNYVTFPRYYLLFDEQGRLRDPEGPADAAAGVLDQLHWWSTALLGRRLSATTA